MNSWGDSITRAVLDATRRDRLFYGLGVADVIVRPGEVEVRRVPPAWPQDVTVPPPPMRGRMVIYTPPPPELPEGLWERAGRLFYECRSCECAVELQCEPEEFDPATAYCGGSPRCLP